jgi:hypothetical protein
MKGFNYFFRYWDNTLQVWIDVKSPRTDKGQAELARKYHHCLGIRYGKYRGDKAPIDNTPPFYVIYND